MTRGSDLSEPGLIVGVGCECGTSAREVMTLVADVLAETDFPVTPVLAIATLDARAAEPAILDVARQFAVPLLTFGACRLEAETPRLATPSAQVYRLTGCHGVAEGAALAAAGPVAVLLVSKHRSAHATAAVAFVESSQELAAGCCQSESAASLSESGSIAVARMPEPAE